MKINEVEALVGITKKNIRFYEEQGLLNPERNRENGYRSYGEAEIEVLRQIKLLRKLGLPLAEIRAVQQKELTLEDALRRHQVVLERQRDSLEQADALCRRLREEVPALSELDGTKWLNEMERMEQEGTLFMDQQKKDERESRGGAVLAAAVFIVLMALIIALLVWAETVDPIPLPILIGILVFPVAVIAGVLLALSQRLRDIGKGELDEASKY